MTWEYTYADGEMVTLRSRDNIFTTTNPFSNYDISPFSKSATYEQRGDTPSFQEARKGCNLDSPSMLSLENGNTRFLPLRAVSSNPWSPLSSNIPCVCDLPKSAPITEENSSSNPLVWSTPILSFIRSQRRLE